MIDMLKALSDPNRLKIVKLLSKKPLCVCEIEKTLGLPQNLVSHHLSTLKAAGVVEHCKCGKNHFYSLSKNSLSKLATDISKITQS